MLALPLDRRHLPQGAARGRIVSVVVIIAIGVSTDGRREVLDLEIGTCEAEPIWTELLCRLTLVISDVSAAIRSVALSVVGAGHVRPAAALLANS